VQDYSPADAVREKDLHGLVNVPKEQPAAGIPRGKSRYAGTFNFVHEGVIGIAKGGDGLLGKIPAAVADQIHGGFYAVLLRIPEKGCHNSSMLCMRCVEAIQKQNVADVEHLAIELGEVNIGGGKLGVSATMVEKGTLTGSYHAHDIAEACQGGAGDHDAGGVDSVSDHFTKHVFSTFVLADTSYSCQRKGAVYSRKIHKCVWNTATDRA
jgi:hypothetical protein